MATDPSDFCTNALCGGARDACGCPHDINTQALMACPSCGGEWWREHGGTSTRCLHRACGKEGSVVRRAPLYAPAVDEAGAPLDIPDADPDDCFAELIDGSWTNCGCPDCEQRETEDDETEMYG
ncbi:hypothetical protein ABZ135_12555 [Streptomyces sp. NPDC006339]|uniref:hypothetical protein n=1 Tax=Streptomyces sp. NPDC006339 TaxID=3156755 RepID=UPI0033BEB3C8